MVNGLFWWEDSGIPRASETGMTIVNRFVIPVLDEAQRWTNTGIPANLLPLLPFPANHQPSKHKLSINSV